MDNELRIKIGGIKTSIRSDNTDFIERMRSGYGQFVWSGSGGIDFLVKMQGLPFLKGGQGVFISQDLVTVKENGLEGCFDLKKRKGDIFIQPQFLIEGVLNLLKGIYSLLVVKKGGLVLHASGILRQGKVYIFFGPSGSGKSTVAKLSTQCQDSLAGGIVLDEESVFIAEVHGSYQASGQKVAGSFPVYGLYKLSKDRVVYLRRLSFSEALSEVFTVPWPLKDLAWHEMLLANFSKLARTLPCFDLHFRPDNSFWGCIDEYSKNLSN